MLTTHLDDYFLERQLSETTRGHYLIVAGIFDRWHDAAAIPSEPIDKTLNRFLAWYETQVDSPNTVLSKRSILLAILRHAGHDIRADKIRRVKRRRTIIDSWTVEQTQTLIYAATTIPGMIKRLGTKRGDYAAAMLSLVFETGLRRSDVIRVTAKQVRAGRWKMAQQKTGNIVECAISAITRQKIVSLPCFDGLAFPAWTAGHAEAVSNLAKRAMSLAWLESEDGCLKKLRRTSITIAEVLAPGTGYLQGGHTTPKITQEHYIDTSQIERKRPVVG